MVEVGLIFEDFKDRVGSNFTVSEEGLPAAVLKLEEATLLPVRNGPKGMRPPFSLIFLGPSEFVLPQKLYRMKHDVMGEVTFFMVPVGKDDRGVSYQALFN